MFINFLQSDKPPTKCVYDERMFASQNDSKEESKFEVDTNNTEDDYFEIMKNMNGDIKVRNVILESMILKYKIMHTFKMSKVYSSLSFCLYCRLQLQSREMGQLREQHHVIISKIFYLKVLTRPCLEKHQRYTW